MRSLKLALLATAATAVLSSATFAADLIIDTPRAPVVIDNGFTWDGAYIGAFLQGQSAPDAFGIGVNLGVNVLMDNLLIGGELEAVASTDSNFSGQGTVKLGGLIGDSAIIYAFTGVGSRTTTSWYAPVGAGIEFALADNLGLKAEAQYNFDLTHSSEDSAAVKVGLNWHF
jgi:opacity protein-like surface antigen